MLGGGDSAVVSSSSAGQARVAGTLWERASERLLKHADLPDGARREPSRAGLGMDGPERLEEFE